MKGGMNKERGVALITALMFLGIVLAVTLTYSFITRSEMRGMHASKSGFSGFNAAEAGLNLRADLIKNRFEDYDRPSGTSPESLEACGTNSTIGTGDFACRDFQLGNKHTARTYVVEDPTNPKSIVIPPGEPYGGLSASEYRYTVTSVGQTDSNPKESNLQLVFKSRLIPIFQFLVFFDDDLELVSGTGLHGSGPIHSNGDIYHAMQAAWWISDPHTYWMGPITSVGQQFRGLKSVTSCHVPSGQGDDGYYYDIYVHDHSSYRVLPGCPGDRFHLTNEMLAPFNGNMAQNVKKLTVPNVHTFDAFALHDPNHPNSFTYWERSDVRLVLKLTGAGEPDTSHALTGIEVVDSAGNLKAAATSKLNNPALCPGNIHTGGGAGLAVGAKGEWAGIYAADDRLRLFRDFTLYPAVDNFETVLDIDMRNLLACMHNYHSDFFENDADLDGSSDGGLVLFTTVSGPNSAASHNNYAMRISNAAELKADVAHSPSAPAPRAMTIVTDQKAVLWGDFNSVDASWIPAAVISDSQYVLSNVWTDALSTHTRDGAACGDGWGCSGWWNRFTGASPLKVRAAILSGVGRACGANGATCEGYLQSSGGGYYGMFRFNETWYDGTNMGTTSWTQPNFDWKGSIASVHPPQHNQTLMVGPVWYFSEPAFVWAFDTRFNDPANLPPLTPQAVYNKQELFERDYD